jgi:signal transduction histidine kinase
LIVSVVCLSVQHGAKLAYRLLLGSLLLVGVSFLYYHSTLGANFNQSEFLLNSSMMLAVGYSVAWWGGRQWRVKRQTLLLKNISHISNPRFGVERSLWVILDQVRDFYEADSCLLVLRENDQYYIQRANREQSTRATRPQVISSEFGRQVLVSSPDLGFLWPASPIINNAYAYEVGERRGEVTKDKECLTVAHLLDAKSFISIPFKMADDAEARVYVLSQKRKRFHNFELVFLHEAVNSFVPVIENIRLVDRLASEAAAVERKRIARDLHDSTIQPVIGLQFGLMAIARKLSEGSADVSQEVERLLQLTDSELGDLRKYVHGLHRGESKVSGLISALESFIKRFSDSSGINVELVISKDFSITDRLAAEVFQLIAEALSNIRRHTKSTRALVSLSCGQDQFLLHVQNDNHLGGIVDFCPRSLSERTNALGGRLTVTHSHDNSTDLNIAIPL